MFCAWICSFLFLWMCVSVGKGITKQDRNIARSYNYPYNQFRGFQKTVHSPWIKRPHQYETRPIDPQSYFRMSAGSTDQARSVLQPLWKRATGYCGDLHRNLDEILRNTNTYPIVNNYGYYDSRILHQPSPKTSRYPYYNIGSRPNGMMDDPTKLLNRLENVILLYRRKAMEIIPNIGILNITSRQRLLKDYLAIADRLYILFVRLSTQLKMYLTGMVDRRTWMLKLLMDLSSLTIHKMQPRQQGVPINEIRKYFMQLGTIERTLNLNCLIYFLENMSLKQSMDNPKPTSTEPTPVVTTSWMLPFSNLRNITYGSVFYFPEKSETLNKAGQN